MISSTNQFAYLIIFNVINFSLFLYVEFCINSFALFFPVFSFFSFFKSFTIISFFYYFSPENYLYFIPRDPFFYSICIFWKDFLLMMRCIVSKIDSRSLVKVNTFLPILVSFSFSLFLSFSSSSFFQSSLDLSPYVYTIIKLSIS